VDSTFSFFHPPADATADEVRGRLATLQTLIDRAPVPIAIAHDPDCHYISGNEALVRLLGLPPDANISLTPPEGQEPFYRIQRNGEDIPSTELPMQYRDRQSHARAQRHRDRAARRDRAVCAERRRAALRQCRPRHRLRQRRRRFHRRKYAEDLLREADQRKDEFLATLSHELRNPLAPIRHALELMRRRRTMRADAAGRVRHGAPAQSARAPHR
jgi:signal transduction histidine kinase